MQKETLVKCVPVEMIERLKKLLERLWADNNPAGVHLGAIMDEFDSDIKALSGVLKEYEADFASRLKFTEEEYKTRIGTLETDLAGCKARMSGVDKNRGENDKKIAELSEILKRKEAELASAKGRFAEEESQLNSKYVAKMQELYDRVSRKELEILSRWEEKNNALDAKYGAMETEYAARSRQLKLREEALEKEFSVRKEQLIKTFDRVRLELNAREANVLAIEEKLAKK